MIDIIVEGNSLRTRGLRELLGSEIRALISDSTMTASASMFLQWADSTIRANPGSPAKDAKLEYGYWQVRLREAADGYLDAWEYSPDHLTLRRGISQALTYWDQQSAVCRRNHAAFSPPSCDLLAGVSPGVLEDVVPLYAIRHLAPSHMSGWYCWTDLYEGENRKMTPEHLYHITAARPMLAKYLALPVGYRITLRDTESVEYDKEVAEEPIP